MDTSVQSQRIETSRPTRSETITKIAAALVKAQALMPTVPKNGKGAYGPYSTLDDTVDAIRPALEAAEITVYQRILTIDGKPTMCTMLLHSSGEFFDDCELELKFESNGRMTAMQAMGSAVTYSRRYSLQAVVGVAPGDDDDGAGAGRVAKDESPKQTAPKKPPVATKKEQKIVEPSQPGKPSQIVPPADYVLPFSDLKGKRLGEIPLSTLVKILAWVESELQKKPDAARAKVLLEAQLKLKAMIPPEKPTPPEPEDPGPQPSDEPPLLDDGPFPEDEPQSMSSPENESQVPQPKGRKKADIADFILPELAIVEDMGLAGKALRQVPEGDLRKLVLLLENAAKKVPTPKNFKDLFELATQIRTFFRSMGV